MNFKPPSLAQLFDPPEYYRGIFGWICGYSGDAAFLEDAIERFSGLTQGQRAYQGGVFLALMLDPGNPQILPGEIPGVLHLPIKNPTVPFQLLHAKVALLGFRHHEKWLLRLIVTTGNWTRQTLEESLDLAWHIDFVSDGADESAVIQRQKRCDLLAGWSLLKWLCEQFDTRSLNSSRSDETNETKTAAALLESWIDSLAPAPPGSKPRFIDNRTTSLADQLSDLVIAHASSTSRNYIAIGSGFYESAKSSAPNVARSIVSRLQTRGLLTSTSDKELYVNPFSCQGIANSQDQIEKDGWTIRAPSTPGYFGRAPRTLHAKFIFSTNCRENSNNCSNPWIYLGSGNLTNPGFMHRAGNVGNLEAGVVFARADLKWKHVGDVVAEQVVTNLLPIHCDDDESTLLPTLQAGDDMQIRGTQFLSPPIALLLWRETPDGSSLVMQGEAIGEFQVLDLHGEPCSIRTDGGFSWSSARPRHVTVRWVIEGTDRVAVVPVIDRYGRFCASEFPALDLDEAWAQLASFPMPPDDEELANGDAMAFVDGIVATSQVTNGRSSAYPVRRMMALIEDIAAKQAQVAQADWTTWCHRLEQVLTQAKDSPIVKSFEAMALNPLSPLLQPAFRPAFADDSHSPEGARYEVALNQVIEAWNLGRFAALGVSA